MEDKKYIVSGAYLSRIKDEIKDTMKMVDEIKDAMKRAEDEPLIMDIWRVKLINQLSGLAEMLSPDIAGDELMEHVCKCKK